MGWLSGGIGIAGIGLGATAGIAGQPRKNTADRKCVDTGGGCTDGRFADAHGSPSLRAVSAAGWIVGAAGLGTAVFLLLSSDRPSGKQTALAADVYGHGAGIHVSRRF